MFLTILHVYPAMGKKYTPHIIAHFPANTHGIMMEMPFESFSFLIIAVISADFRGRNELGDPFPRAE